MTMQVAMIGTDGIVLASDTSRTTVPMKSLPNLEGVEYHVGGSKILFSDDHKIAVSCAENLRSAFGLAATIVSALNGREVADIASLVKEIAAKELAGIQERAVPKCLIAVGGASPHLLLFQFAFYGDELVQECSEQDVMATAGHCSNPAIFWIERYCRRMPTMPVKKLIPLAAHLIFSAALLNPAGIGGLEITYSDRDGFHRLPKEETRRMYSKAREWDERIGNIILDDSVLS
ncbi:MAG: hypothetical protein WCA21_06550 [Terracidiphilus sp.]